MLDHMPSTGVMHRDGRRRGEELVKHEKRKQDIAAVHTQYRNRGMGYAPKIPANQLGKSKSVWPMREYGLYLVCVTRESTVVYILVSELGEMISRGFLKVREVFFVNVTGCPSTSVCCLGCFLNLVASLKDRNDILDCIGGERLSDAVVKEEKHILASLHLG